MEHEIERLLREGFLIHGGSWESDAARFSRADFPGVAKFRSLLDAAPRARWAGFQLYYPMRETEVLRTPGPDLIDSVLAVFREVTPAMNLCMQVSLAI